MILSGMTKMHEMRPIVEAEVIQILDKSEALECIWSKIPDEFANDLVDNIVTLVIQKMDWAYSQERV